MKTMKRSVCLCAAVALLSARTANAQVASPATEKFFVNVSFGGQLASRTLETTTTKTIYEEPATLTSALEISKGALVDLSVGYRVYGDVYAGLAISHFADSGDATYTASVPDPVVFGRPRASTGTVADLERTELSFNPNITWVMPLTDKLDISLGRRGDYSIEAGRRERLHGPGGNSERDPRRERREGNSSFATGITL